VTLVDSSGWLEYFTDGPLAARFAPYLEDGRKLVTPTVVLYEVYKAIKRSRREEDALVAVAQLQKTLVQPLTDSLALAAADVILRHGLAMADAIVYSTAQAHAAELVTSDKDFATLPGV